MSFLKKLYSRNFFILNLVLVGALLGAGVTYFGISHAVKASSIVRAESPLASAPAEVKAALDQADAVQSAFRYVAEKVQPSVVEINVVEKIQSNNKKDSPQDQLPWRFFFNSPRRRIGPAGPALYREGPRLGHHSGAGREDGVRPHEQPRRGLGQTRSPSS